jgi:hypothetical protein
MGFKLTTSKETAIRAFINEWLRDSTVYCNYCGEKYVVPPVGCEEMICCDRRQLGTNLTLLHALIQENKRIRETRANAFASNKDMSFRLGISMIPRLMSDLEDYSINTLKEPLWKDSNEMNDFMRSFPQFCIPEKV